MQPQPARPILAEVIAALVAGALAVGGALALNALPASETGGSANTISPSRSAWWILIALIPAQVILPMWAGHFPRAVQYGTKRGKDTPAETPKAD